MSNNIFDMIHHPNKVSSVELTELSYDIQSNDLFNLQGQSSCTPDIMGDLLENHLLPSPLPSNSEKCLLCRSHSCLSPFLYCEQCTNTVFTHPSISFPFKFCLHCHTFHYYLFFQRIEEASSMRLSSSCVEGHQSLPSGLHLLSPPLLSYSSLQLSLFSMVKPSSIQLPSQETPTHCSLCHTPSTTSICQVCQLGYIFQLSDSSIKYCTHCHTFHLLDVFYSSTAHHYLSHCVFSSTNNPANIHSFLENDHSTLSEETLHSFVEKQQLEAYFYLLFLDLYQEENTQFPKNLNDQIHHQPEHCSVCQASLPSSSFLREECKHHYFSLPSFSFPVRYCSSCHYIHSFIYFIDPNTRTLQQDCQASSLLYFLFDTYHCINSNVDVVDPSTVTLRSINPDFFPSMVSVTCSPSPDHYPVCSHCGFFYPTQPNTELNSFFVCSYCMTHLFYLHRSQLYYKYCPSCHLFRSYFYFYNEKTKSFQSDCIYNHITIQNLGMNRYKKSTPSSTVKKHKTYHKQLAPSSVDSYISTLQAKRPSHPFRNYIHSQLSSPSDYTSFLSTFTSSIIESRLNRVLKDNNNKSSPHYNVVLLKNTTSSECISNRY